MSLFDTNPPARLLVYGAGGLARELAWLVEQLNLAGRPCQLLGFVSDLASQQGGTVHGLPVWSFDQALQRNPGVPVVLGVGAVGARLHLAERLRARGVESALLVHPATCCSSRSSLGPGCVLQVGAQLTVGVRLGPHVLLNGNLTVGHDTQVGACSVLGPGCNLSGHVQVGEGVMIGSGATVIEGRPDKPLRIGDGAVVGAGACVIEDVPAGALVVGVPARVVRRS